MSKLLKERWARLAFGKRNTYTNVLNEGKVDASNTVEAITKFLSKEGLLDRNKETIATSEGSSGFDLYVNTKEGAEGSDSKLFIGSLQPNGGIDSYDESALKEKNLEEKALKIALSIQKQKDFSEYE